MTKHRAPTHRLPPASTERARELRNNTSIPERVLWSMLRRKQINGMKFRRQVPFGPYVVDFYCAERQLVIELDGESHNNRREQDAKRSDFHEAVGLRVIRITNHELSTNREGVYEYLLSQTVVTPTPDPPPSPLPKREGEPNPTQQQEY